MKIIRPYNEEVVKLTCSCGCEDSIQFDRYLESCSFNKEEQEELYLLTIKKDAKYWPFSLKFRSLWNIVTNIQSYKNGKNQYYSSNMMNKDQADKFYDILIQDIENFNESIALNDNFARASPTVTHRTLSG